MSKNNFLRIQSQLDLPYLETNYKMLVSIFKTLESQFGLKRQSNQKFIDLGSGNGRIIIYSALNYQIKSVGVEINSSLIKETKDHIISLKKEKKYNKKLLRKIIIKTADFYALNLKSYDFVYIYSLPTMHRYLNHLFKTVKLGAIIISHKFPFKDFSSYLKLEYALEHAMGEEGISTFFYKKYK